VPGSGRGTGTGWLVRRQSLIGHWRTEKPASDAPTGEPGAGELARLPAGLVANSGSTMRPAG